MFFEKQLEIERAAVRLSMWRCSCRASVASFVVTVFFAEPYLFGVFRYLLAIASNECNIRSYFFAFFSDD